MSIKIAITTRPINSQSGPRMDNKMDDLLLKEKTKNKLYTVYFPCKIYFRSQFPINIDDIMRTLIKFNGITLKVDVIVPY